MATCIEMILQFGGLTVLQQIKALRNGTDEAKLKGRSKNLETGISLQFHIPLYIPGYCRHPNPSEKLSNSAFPKYIYL